MIILPLEGSQSEFRGLFFQYYTFISCDVTVEKNLNLKYYWHSHLCPKFRPCFRPSFRHNSEFYHENSSRLLFNVILFSLPGGARQCSRSGHFLVLVYDK